MMTGCRDDDVPQLHLRVGERVETIVPATSHAEYVQIPDGGSELRMSFATYAASCDRFVPPGPDDTVVTVTIVAPAGSEPAKGSFPWAGHAAHGGTPTDPEIGYAVPMLRWGSQGYVIPPGGHLELREVQLEPGGNVAGLLDFESAGSAKEQATRISGSFRADLCRIDRIEAPAD